MLISGKGRSTGSGKLGELPPKLGMGTENSSLDESKPMVLMLGDFYLFQFHSDFKCKNSSRVCYKERQKNHATFSLPTFFWVRRPHLIPPNFSVGISRALLVHVMKWCPCNAKLEAFRLANHRVYSTHRARCLVSGRVIRVRLLIMEGEVHMGKANQLPQNL